MFVKDKLHFILYIQVKFQTVRIDEHVSCEPIDLWIRQIWITIKYSTFFQTNPLYVWNEKYSTRAAININFQKVEHLWVIAILEYFALNRHSYSRKFKMFHTFKAEKVLISGQHTQTH